MIVAVCLNAALDVTYHVTALRPGHTHRVNDVHAHAGGKGTNVARVLHRLGEPVRLVGLAGGATGMGIEADLAAAELGFAMMTIAGESRRTVTVVADDDATLFSEPGPTVQLEEWRRFSADFASAVEAADVVVLSGSLPPGVPTEAYGELTSAARSAGAKVIVDAAGPSLHAALAARPDVVAPNAAEASATLDRPVQTEPHALEAAEQLAALGAGAAIVTRGRDGLVAAADGRHFVVRTPPVSGNATGAGDAFSAGLARGLAAGSSWPDLLADAAALAAGAVRTAHAGAVDPVIVADIRAHIVVEEA